jgi:hypothetical protein
MHAVRPHPAHRPVPPLMGMTMANMINTHRATGPVAKPIHEELHSREESLQATRHFSRQLSVKVKLVR